MMESISSNIFNREDFHDIFEIVDSSPWTKVLFNELLNLWELCTEKDERALIKDLINKFFVLNSQEERNACQGINRYINSLSVTPDLSYIVSVADAGKNDGSLAGLQLLELQVTPLEDWEERYVSHIPDLANLLKEENKIEEGSTIFIFDDFIGTGSKIEKKHNWLANLLNKKGLNINSFDIHIVSFSAMDFGIDYIKNTLGFNVYSHNTFSKAITGKVGCKDSSKKIDVMLKIENKLDDVYKERNISKYSLGYKKSEALYYWENNSCPNNVFPIFWWPMLKGNKRHAPLFNRTN